VPGLSSPMHAIYSGVDHLDTVGTVVPGLLAEEGRCRRMVYENPVGQGGHCLQTGTRTCFQQSLELLRRGSPHWSTKTRCDQMVPAPHG
jgi:hypothetical protein